MNNIGISNNEMVKDRSKLMNISNTIKQAGICLITFSDNVDHQEVIYSMFNALYPNVRVYTIGIRNPKTKIAAYTDNNFYFNCPARPGFSKGTFRISVIRDIVHLIQRLNVRYLYFESLHIWNVFIMLWCKKQIKVEAIHDVIPHDGNIAMRLCNQVTCALAEHVVLRNEKFFSTLLSQYHLRTDKVTPIGLWRSLPAETLPLCKGNFLCFGRIRRYKGFDLLEKIIALTPDITYQIVGAPDEASKELVDKIKRFPNANVVDHEVSDDEMRQYFSDADWVILPYTSATQSGVIVDAYKFSRPVIAFEVGAICEQVVNGVTGFLIPEGDVEQFAQTICKVNRFSNEETKQFAHAAYTFGYEKYSVQNVMSKFLNCLEKIIKK
jgi:glycosyltransferase involved in cell wall biosynthesis